MEKIIQKKDLFSSELEKKNSNMNRFQKTKESNFAINFLINFFFNFLF